MTGERKYDFSILNSQSLAFVIIRAVFPLFIFINPFSVFLVYVLAWVLDSLDDNVIETTSGIKIREKGDKLRYNAYQLTDKVSDTSNTAIFLVFSLFYLPFYPVLILLFFYRLIGVGLMCERANDSLLVFFPNIVGYLLGVLFFVFVFFPMFFFYLQFILLAIILVSIVSVLSILTEIVAHVIKPKILERY